MLICHFHRDSESEIDWPSWSMYSYRFQSILHYLILMGQYDYPLLVYLGEELIDWYCTHNQVPNEIRSTGNTLKVVMVTDENTSFDRGFKATTRTGKLAFVLQVLPLLQLFLK